MGLWKEEDEQDTDADGEEEMERKEGEERGGRRAMGGAHAKAEEENNHEKPRATNKIKKISHVKIQRRIPPAL